MGWADALQSYNADNPIDPERKAREANADEHFIDVVQQIHKQSVEQDRTLVEVPRFFVKKASATDSELSQKFRKEARTRFLQRRAQELLENVDLEQFWTLLSECGGDKINFDQFSSVAQQLPEKMQEYVKPSVFFKHPRDKYGRVGIEALFQYALTKAHLMQTRLTLSYYDTTGHGYLREVDLDNYIFEQIPTFPCLHDLEESFFPFYVCTAVRKFFFFLDPSRTGRVKIKDLITSPILAELFELRNENLSEEEERSNWFSALSALRVYGQYLSLDTDQNGMLSKSELMRYGSGTLTQVFVDRIFQECHTYDDEMDYKTFLDFVLAIENKKTPQGLQYFFRLLDVQKKGAFNIFTINYFFRAVLQALERAGHDLVNAEDVKDEIFDMVKPLKPTEISLQDLISCGVGDTIMSMLTDMNGFWAYDNREELMLHDGSDP